MHWRSVVNRLGAGALATLILVVFAPTAKAEADTADGVWSVEYEGFFTTTGLPAAPHRMGIVCTTASCKVVGAIVSDTRFDRTAITIAGGIASMDTVLPAEGDWCTNIGIEFGHIVSMTATATSFEFVDEVPTVDYSCGPSTTGSAWGNTATWTGTFSAGDICIFAGVESCGGDAPVAAGTATSDAVGDDSTDASADASPRLVSISNGSAASPSALSTLQTLDTVRLDAPRLVLTAALVVVLVLLLAFPTHLLNRASENALVRWRGRSATRTGTGNRWLHTFWASVIGVIAAALISSFVDPGFGFTAASLRVFGSIAVSFAIEVVISWFVLIAVVRRLAPSAQPSFEFKPASLLIVIAAVLFTRFTGFQPAILFGLVAGVAFAAASARLKVRTAVISTCYTMATGLVALILYSVMASGVRPGESVGSQFALETLAALAIGAFAGLPVALLPLRGLGGYLLFIWNRWAWGGLYAIALVAFFIVLMPLPFSWAEVDLEFSVWVSLYVTYALVAVIAWRLLRPSTEGQADAAPTSTEREPDGVRTP